MHGRMATYKFTGDPHDLAQRAEEGMLPILQSQPGFRAYNLVLSGDEIISSTAWDSIEQAEAANDVIAKWVAENIATELELVNVRYAEILLATALGVSAAATAKA